MTVVEVKPGDGAAIWEAVQRALPSEPVSVQTKVGHFLYESCEGDTITLRIDESGGNMARMLFQQGDLVAELIKRTTGKRMKVRIQGEAAGVNSRQDPPQLSPNDVEEVRKLPAVRQAMDLFDATIVRIERDS